MLILEIETHHSLILMSLGLIVIWLGTIVSKFFNTILALLIQIFLTLMMGLYPLISPLAFMFFITFFHGTMAPQWHDSKLPVSRILAILMTPTILFTLIRGQIIGIDLWMIQVMLGVSFLGVKCAARFLKILDTPCNSSSIQTR